MNQKLIIKRSNGTVQTLTGKGWISIDLDLTETNKPYLAVFNDDGDASLTPIRN